MIGEGGMESCRCWGWEILFGLLLIFERNGADSMPGHGKVVNFNIFA